MSAFIAGLTISNTVFGAGTTYLEEQWGGRPLYCSTPQHPLFYDANSPPWAAFPAHYYRDDVIRCGDLVHILEILPDGTTRSSMVRALDAMPDGYCVQRGAGECVKIVVDVLGHIAMWPGISALRVRWIDISAVARECRERGRCD